MKTKAILTFEDVVNELVLPEWLNGKEVSHDFFCEDKGDKNTLMETCRCFQSFYDVICSARLNLACACRKEYPELLDKNNPLLSQVWMRSQFVNNSILWYNAAFDLALQPLWLYYKVYTKSKTNFELTTENLDRILENCRFDSLKKNGTKEIGDKLILKLDIINSKMKENIRLWANILKHRKKIDYVELAKKDHPIAIGGKFAFGKDENGNKIIKLFEGEYNSSKTIKYIYMTEVVNTLFSFHKDIISISKDIEAHINL